MFYSKPNIKPLNIDLEALPEPQGSRNLYARSIDGTHIGIRVSDRNLQVRTSPPDGTKEYLDMNEILLTQVISPYYIDDPDPEVFCDLLGLTVQGEAIKVKEKPSRMQCDLSGNTTYWQSEHLVYPKADITEFVKSIEKMTSDVVLVRRFYDEGSSTYKKEVTMSISNGDDHVILIFGVSPEEVKKNINSSDDFPYFKSVPLYFSIGTKGVKDDPSGASYYEKSSDFLDKKYNYQTQAIKRFGFATSYNTGNEFAQSLMKQVHKIIMDQFSCALKNVKLDDQKLLEKFPIEHPYSTWISNALIDWSNKSPENYLWLGQHQGVFCGWKPNG
jgi:hypothetical protein